MQKNKSRYLRNVPEVFWQRIEDIRRADSVLSPGRLITRPETLLFIMQHNEKEQQEHIEAALNTARLLFAKADGQIDEKRMKRAFPVRSKTPEWIKQKLNATNTVSSVVAT